MILLSIGFLSSAIAAVKLLIIQLVLSGRARLRRERYFDVAQYKSVERCLPHNHVEKILVQIKGATAY